MECQALACAAHTIRYGPRRRNPRQARSNGFLRCQNQISFRTACYFLSPPTGAFSTDTSTALPGFFIQRPRSAGLRARSRSPTRSGCGCRQSIASTSASGRECEKQQGGHGVACVCGVLRTRRSARQDALACGAQFHDERNTTSARASGGQTSCRALLETVLYFCFSPPPGASNTDTSTAVSGFFPE